MRENRECSAHTMEPLNSGHVGTSHSVQCLFGGKTALLVYMGKFFTGALKSVLYMYMEVNVLCPLFGVYIDSTVDAQLWTC